MIIGEIDILFVGFRWTTIGLSFMRLIKFSISCLCLQFMLAWWILQFFSGRRRELCLFRRKMIVISSFSLKFMRTGNILSLFRRWSWHYTWFCCDFVRTVSTLIFSFTFQFEWRRLILTFRSSWSCSLLGLFKLVGSVESLIVSFKILRLVP